MHACKISRQNDCSLLRNLVNVPYPVTKVCRITLEYSVSADPALVVEGIHKSFGDVEVLRGVSLVAQTGDVISMLGASGSGKSTLLRCINLLEIPNSGDVTVHGEKIQMTTDRRGNPAAGDLKQVARIRSQLGMVFQNFNLWEHMKASSPRWFSI